MKLCKVCNNPNETKYQHCSDECKKEYHKQKQKEQYGTLKENHKISKLNLIKLMGGSCSSCGYSKNMAALVFHHIDQKTTNTTLDARNIMYMQWSDILEESKNCILLCHNCQRELLYGDEI